MIMLGLGAMLLPAPSQAKWYEASSDNFVIYADDSEADIRRFAQNLEKYHSAMELVLGRDVEAPSPSNRVVIFVVGSQNDVRKLTRSRSRAIAGFYVPRAGASRAYVQNIRFTDDYPHFSTVVLLHEYAHHFLIASSRSAMPRWISEGAAEFFSAASFSEEGGVRIGRPAMHRRAEIVHARNVTVNELLDPDLYAEKRRRQGDAFYSKSWALFHYLMFEPARAGQLGAYQRALLEGASMMDAAQETFGDIDALDDEVDEYLRQREMLSFNFGPERIDYGTVTLRELPRGEAEMLDVRMLSQRGVTREEAEKLLKKARKIARKYPRDAGVQTGLAEAEFDAGNDDEAIAAAERAIALDPSRANAYVQKGYALFRKASDADDKDAAFAEAMKPFSALNRIENDHPVPLIYYYRSFLARGEIPSEQARRALERASEIAPFDHELAMNASIMLAREGRLSDAAYVLRPVARNPHGGTMAELAETYLASMEATEEGAEWSPPEDPSGALTALSELAPDGAE